MFTRPCRGRTAPRLRAQTGEQGSGFQSGGLPELPAVRARRGKLEGYGRVLRGAPFPAPSLPRVRPRMPGRMSAGRLPVFPAVQTMSDWGGRTVPHQHAQQAPAWLLGSVFPVRAGGHCFPDCSALYRFFNLIFSITLYPSIPSSTSRLLLKSPHYCPCP